MALRMHNIISTVMRRLEGRGVKGIGTMITFTRCISCGRSSLLFFILPSKNIKFGNLLQAQKMALLSDSLAQTVKEIKFDDLQEQLNNNNIILIDVREPKELIKDGAIPKSVNIPLGDIKGAFALTSEKFEHKYGISLPSKDDAELVLSCQSGRRATMATEELHKMGYINAKCYCGSFLDWKAKGGQIVRM